MSEYLTWSALEDGMVVSPVPVWLLDMESRRICWANAPALELWAAADVVSLQARDMLTHAPPKILARLDRVIAAVRAGQLLQEEWAFYPGGEPVMVLLHLRAVTLANGRLAMLNQAMPVTDAAPPSLLRGITALRHTSLIIAYVNADGRIRMQNPAAMETFAEGDLWSSWLANPDDGKALVAQALRNEPVRVELTAVTKAGQRFHAVDLHSLRDPVSGDPGVLIEHTDVTARIAAEKTAHERLRIVERQHQEIVLLAAPILDVGLGTIAVPIIGELNTERCQILAERLLHTLVERRARRVIIDLTGVTGIHSAGVSALARLLEAVRLLGSVPILTGIGTELARHLADSQLLISQLETRRSLAEVISHLSSVAR